MNQKSLHAEKCKNFIFLPLRDNKSFLVPVYVPIDNYIFSIIDWFLNILQNHWFTYNEKMSVESVTQSVSNLALQFGDDDADPGAMVMHAWQMLFYISPGTIVEFFQQQPAECPKMRILVVVVAQQNVLRSSNYRWI